MPKERPKSPKKPELTQAQIEQMGYSDKMTYFLSRGEFFAMAGVWISRLAGGKEKTRVADAETREGLTELHTEVDEVKGEREELVLLREELEITEAAEEAGEILNAVLDVLDWRKVLVIGDSICHGFQLKCDEGKRPTFIGHDGYSSPESLALLEETAKSKPGKFKGKEKAIIYTGGNNVMDGNPQNIVADAIKMAKICESKGIPEIIICTRFPMDPRKKQDIIDGKGQDRLDRKLSEGEQLRDSMLLAYNRREFPDGTKLVDLTTQFQDEKGTLQEQYAKGAKGHPYRAYKPALNYMQLAESGLTKEEAKKRAVESKEHPELNKVAVIGSSSGSRMSAAGGLNMSQGRLTSRQIYELVVKRQAQLEGMTTAVLQMGGNDIARNRADGYQNVIDYTNKIIAICKKQGIKDVIIMTGIPFDPRAAEGSYAKRVKNAPVLRKTLVDYYGGKSEIDGVKIHTGDMFEKYADSNGYLKKEYRKGKGDTLHARDQVLQQGLIDMVASVS